jgi:hypothetical protein
MCSSRKPEKETPMLHDLWMIFAGWVMRKVFDAGWDYTKQWVQAVLVVQFVVFFIASYVSQPSPIAGHRAGCALSP